MRLFFSTALLAAMFAAAATAAEFDPSRQHQFEAKRQEVEAKRQAMFELQRRLMPLIRGGERNEEARQQAAELEKQISALGEEVAQLERQLQEESGSSRDPAQTIAALQAELAMTQRQFAQTRQELEFLRHNSRYFESPKDLPEIPNGEVKVLGLGHTGAAEMAKTLESLFGPKVLRLAIDDRANALIALGSGDTLSAVESLVGALDQQAAPPDATGAGASDNPAASLPRSLLLRIFWLADDLPKGEGRPAELYLPASVLKATEQLGLETPSLVAQTVSSLAVGGSDPVPFATSVPVVVFKTPVQLTCQGALESIASDQTKLEVTIQLPAFQVDLQGSLATPLGHYMVLGTATSVIGDPAMMAAGRMQMMGGGMGMMGGEMGMPMQGGFGMGRAMGRAGSEAMAEGMAPDQAMGAEAESPAYSTSRFAFVVQVIEGESYPADTNVPQAATAGASGDNPSE